MARTRPDWSAERSVAPARVRQVEIGRFRGRKSGFSFPSAERFAEVTHFAQAKQPVSFVFEN